MKKETSNFSENEAMQYEPVLATALTEHKIQQLHIDGEVDSKLSSSKKFNLMWWKILKPKRYKEFYYQISVGTMTKYAYQYAERCC